MEIESDESWCSNNSNIKKTKTASYQFRHCFEILFHNEINGTFEKVRSLLYTLGSIQTVLKNGISEKQLGWDKYHKLIGKLFRPGSKIKMHYSYKARIGSNK